MSGALTAARLLVTSAGAHAGPDTLPEAGWIAAAVPGTAAAALEAAGLWSRRAPTPLHDRDIWYRLDLPPHDAGRLVFEGLATVAEVWLDGTPLLTSVSMFERHTVEVPASAGPRTLAIAFRSLSTHLDTVKGPRARWRATMIPDQRLRLVRTTLLGHMPGWSPPVDAVGPWRAIRLEEGPAGPAIRRLDAGADGGTATLALTVACPGDTVPEVSCAGIPVPLEVAGEGLWSGRIDLPGLALWWPHSHGRPALHDLVVTANGRRLVRRIGFRALTLGRGADGRDFRIEINGVPVFARGACWTPADLVSLASDAAALRPKLQQAVAAGVTMLRVGGTMVYEARDFHDLCDEMGIMVFQDLMCANFDYPASDPAFLDGLAREVAALLDRLVASPALVVLCGGSEIHQQAAMMGLPPDRSASAFLDTLLPEQVRRARPDVVYLPSSPYGGALPFLADAGVGHYYGVGAYERPLEDARRAGVRFAAECLAFANVPEPATLARDMAVPAVHDPRWKAGVPRDVGASWDFEDTRDHYLARLFGIDPARLRREDPERYLDLSRAVIAEVVERTMDEFRRPGSPTGGALVWFWRDIAPGAGWGLVDAAGIPKSPWYALRRAFAPLRLMATDEGVNGLVLHLVNDGPVSVAGTLVLDALRDGAVRVAGGRRDVTVPPRGGLSLNAVDLAGGFFDFNHAYRFGPPAHDCVVVRLEGAGGVLAETVHLAASGLPPQRRLDLVAEAGRDAEGPYVDVACAAAALWLQLRDDTGIAADSYLHLPPGPARRLRFLGPETGAPAPTRGTVLALNGNGRAAYRLPPG